MFSKKLRHYITDKTLQLAYIWKIFEIWTEVKGAKVQLPKTEQLMLF